MIAEVDITAPARTHVKWLGDVEAFKTPRKFEFKPGLNILWGPNGSGKSTLLRALALMFHCEQSGFPVVTQESLSRLIDRWHFGRDEGDMAKMWEAFHVKHDGQGVQYFNPEATVGLTAGGAAFDWDFGAEGMNTLFFKGSAGQTTMQRSDKVIKNILNGVVPSVEWKFQRAKSNDIWQNYCNLADAGFKGEIPKGQPTVLLDEPERSFDMPTQVAIWRLIRAFSAKVQFIVASHSFFALALPEAHYIEMKPGYLDLSVRAYSCLLSFSGEGVRPIPKPSDLEPAKKKPVKVTAKKAAKKAAKKVAKKRVSRR